MTVRRSPQALWCQSFAILVATAAFSAGCIDERPPAPKTFPVATENDAAARIRAFFDAYVSGDVDEAAAFLCDIGEQERESVKALIARSHAPTAPFRLDQVEVRAVASHWAGTEPTFWVEVSFPRSDGNGSVNSAYRVRVKTGCIENFVNAIPADQDEERKAPKTEDVPPRIPTLPPPPTAPPTPPRVQAVPQETTDSGVRSSSDAG